jgi:hypothetical protein
MREMGFYHILFDLLDERPFAISELKDFMKILFGEAVLAEVPDPEDDWKGFCDVIARLVQQQDKQWNPLSNRLEPWIDMKKLKQQYGRRGFFGRF